jgi:transcription antitermination factor NusG
MNFVYWLGRPAIIRNEEIEDIRAFLGNYQDASIEIVSYEPGENVQIIAGPFVGQSGKISEVRNNTAQLVIKSLGILVRVVLNTRLLDKTDSFN